MKQSALLASLAVAALLTIADQVDAGEQDSKIWRASVSSHGKQGDMFSVRPELSADGKAVVFLSMSSNLVGNRAPGMNIYFHDIRSANTSLINVSADGNTLGVSTDPAVSGNASVVAFASTPPVELGGARQIYIRSRTATRLEIVSVDREGRPGKGDSATPALSFDGNVVAFVSASPELAPGCTRNQSNIFARDISKSTTVCVSVGFDGSPANGPSYQPSISSGGRIIAFRSSATNLVPNDTNGVDDIFVRNLESGTTVLASVGSGKDAIFQANRESIEPSISNDGTRVAFVSFANNLVSDDKNNVEDVFVRDLSTSKTLLVSRSTTGATADAHSAQPRISGNGRYVVFLSPSTDLAGTQLNRKRKVYVHDIESGKTQLVTRGSRGSEARGDSLQPAISSDGKVIAFRSNAPNLVPGDTNFTDDIFYVEYEGRPEGE